MIPDTPESLVRAIDSVLTWDHPAFPDFARSLSSLVVCHAEVDPQALLCTPEPDDPLPCDETACGCGASAVPITRRLLGGLGLDVAKSLAWLSDELYSLPIDPTETEDGWAACDCLIVDRLAGILASKPEFAESVWAWRQASVRWKRKP